MKDHLSPDELRARFEQFIVPDYIVSQAGLGMTILGPPRFVSVGGQPGSGKGGVLNTVQRALPRSVIVNGDDLRMFHPAYEWLMRKDPLRMPEVTASASGPWVGMANEYLRSQRISAIVETTLRDAVMLRGEFEAFKVAGYETELRVVAVPLEVSRAGTVSRYIEQVKDFGAGRWTPGAAHDEAAGNVLGTVRELVASGAVDRVVIQNRNGHVFHDAVVTAGGAEQAEAAVQAVDRARDVRNLSAQQAKSWIEYTVEALQDCVRLKQRNPDVRQVIHRIVTQDAHAVVMQAYPNDRATQSSVLSEFEQANFVAP